MTVLTILFTLSLLSSAAMADTYCYYDSFGEVVCRQRLSSAARIAIAVASFVVVFVILLAFAMHRRRKIAQANMAFVHASQNQQQGLPNQYPPPTQGGFFGAPFGGNGQKEHHGYDPQQHNGQYNPQYNEQYNQQYNGQYGSQSNTPQYPPAAYDQGNPNQPAPPYPSYPPPSGPPPPHH